MKRLLIYPIALFALSFVLFSACVESRKAKQAQQELRPRYERTCEACKWRY